MMSLSQLVGKVCDRLIAAIAPHKVAIFTTIRYD